MTVHPIAPVFDKNSKLLILGSFPSVKSRENGFFYGHPQNRFWRVTAAVLGCAVPENIEEKKSFLLGNGIALWDVIASCDITGSADSSIANVVPNDLSVILDCCNIKSIFVNGKTAEKYYNRYIYPQAKISALYLPSTSPANASKNLETLINDWRILKKNL